MILIIGNKKIQLLEKLEEILSSNWQCFLKYILGYIEIDWNTNTIIAKPKIDSSDKRFILK
jgi:hypothetical protein